MARNRAFALAAGVWIWLNIMELQLVGWSWTDIPLLLAADTYNTP